MKRGRPRAIYILIIGVAPWFIGMVLFPPSLNILSRVPSFLKISLIHALSALQSLSDVWAPLPLLTYSVTLAILSYGIPRAVTRAVDFINS